MFDDVRLDVEYFATLMRADERIAAAVAKAGCPLCGGPLHVANYQRKPRGDTMALEGEAFTLRLGLCCGRQGCRRRVLPPSLRFLGRRVYLEVVVVFVTAWAQVAGAARVATGASARTLGRWRRWWQGELPQLGFWAELRARFVSPSPDESQLPLSLLEYLGRLAKGAELAHLVARCLAPGTTLAGDVSRFVRDTAEAGAQG
jgi:hypothetical protein